MAWVGTEGRKGRSCWRFIIFADLEMESLCSVVWQGLCWPAGSALCSVTPSITYESELSCKDWLQEG